MRKRVERTKELCPRCSYPRWVGFGCPNCGHYNATEPAPSKGGGAGMGE